MNERLYYLSDEEFNQIDRLLPCNERGQGRPLKISNRNALEGILHILRTGTPWRDLPQEYGYWHTIYMRWKRWTEHGVWWEILMLLKRLKCVDIRIVFLDSSVVRAHQHAAGAQKKRVSKPLVEAEVD
jgi:putative transposase